MVVLSQVDQAYTPPPPASSPLNNEFVASVCEILTTSARLASETGDYASFSSVLDISLKTPAKFSPDAAALVLIHLHNIVAAQHKIAYEVGWDMLELLLEYVDVYSGGAENHTGPYPAFRAAMALFNLICEYGNHGALLLRACELMNQIGTSRDAKRLAALSLDENTLDACVVKESVDASPGFDFGSSVRHEDMKFCVLFEVVRFSLLRVETAHPSAYLLEAASTLLQVADDPGADLLSVSTYGRRMYLLARDFDVANRELVSEDEFQRIRNLLVNFVSHAADVLVRRYSLKWAERLYVQMRYKVAMAPPSERRRVYSETEYTRRMSEVMARLSQQILSYDCDPDILIPRFIGFDIDVASGNFTMVEPRIPQTQVEGVETFTRSLWSEALVKGMSIIGLSAMKTQLHFDSSRRDCKNVRMNMLFTIEMRKRLNKYISSKDISLYWSLWSSNFVQASTMIDVDEPLLYNYLNVLLGYISDSNCSAEQFVTGSVIARALRFQSTDFAFNFCINVMRTSNSPAEQFVAVETLKSLATGKICHGSEHDGSVCDQTEAKFSAMELGNHFDLSPERRREIALVSLDSIMRLTKHSNRFPCYYINLLSVVKTDRDIVLKICDEVEAKCATCRINYKNSSNCMVMIGILLKGVTQLREFANTF